MSDIMDELYFGIDLSGNKHVHVGGRCYTNHGLREELESLRARIEDLSELSQGRLNQQEILLKKIREQAKRIEELERRAREDEVHADGLATNRDYWQRAYLKRCKMIEHLEDELAAKDNRIEELERRILTTEVEDDGPAVKQTTRSYRPVDLFPPEEGSQTEVHIPVRTFVLGGTEVEEADDE